MLIIEDSYKMLDHIAGDKEGETYCGLLYRSGYALEDYLLSGYMLCDVCHAKYMEQHKNKLNKIVEAREMYIHKIYAHDKGDSSVGILPTDQYITLDPAWYTTCYNTVDLEESIKLVVETIVGDYDTIGLHITLKDKDCFPTTEEYHVTVKELFDLLLDES
jgi:hypothetical protein